MDSSENVKRTPVGAALAKGMKGLRGPAEQQLAVVAVATPGLQNDTGEYNCFLNVIIQCLWHCQSFRAELIRVRNKQQQLAAHKNPRKSVDNRSRSFCESLKRSAMKSIAFQDLDGASIWG